MRKRKHDLHRLGQRRHVVRKNRLRQSQRRQKVQQHRRRQQLITIHHRLEEDE